jgi:hypothetical protein
MSRVDVRADERFAASQDSAFTETQWHLDYRPDMDPEAINVPATRRLLFTKHGRTTVFDIRSAQLLANGRGIELITLAQVA